ncbi:NAD-dependent epimerase/dehydratase family protein [Clavibacter michiganensis subsp. phaseoli]|uniref:NAD-dependent epimerase/dehydratase family protein n=1 Tax=Clavibacter phaseoli TaxID=1734031 RepID=A0A8I0S822_9MICO|nr:NAD-dependent epimerase/dehydratase family protein [Clavibacter phaseoli]MBF4629720.1 NAD-dependent epimerase/dehydratase family protein [Clavibacter phaseoli]
MKILVTGAAGFVGSSLVERALRDGHSVVGIDALTDYYDVALKETNLQRIASPDFTLVREDINNVDLSALFDGVDVVFHQAGQPGVRKSWGKDFATYTTQNILATQKLLEQAKKSPELKRFVYASSSSIYGNAASYPTLETDRPEPISPYGVSKLAAEHLCTLYGKNFGVPTTSLRYFTVFGPRQRPDMAFTRFLQAALNGTEITVFGTGEQIRDFTYIQDVVDANFLAANSETAAGSIYNVAGGSNVSVNEVLDTIRRISGAALNVRRIDPVPGDVWRTGGSSERIRGELGWKPKYSVEEGLRAQYEWVREL